MRDFLYSIPPWVFITVIVHLVVLGTVAYMILLERKVASWAQDRIGPNRVGLGFGIIPWLKDKKMFGLGQPLADGMKFIFKEDYQPAGVDKYLFTLAPVVMITVVIISIAVVPWGGTLRTTMERDVTAALVETNGDEKAAAAQVVPIGSEFFGVVEGTRRDVPDSEGKTRTLVQVTYDSPFQIADLNIGALFVLVVLSLAVYGVVIGGWASNNKYSFLGGLRATAQMVSYEIPLGLSLLVVVVMTGTLELDGIVNRQAHYWFGFIPAWNWLPQWPAFLLFLICIHAEANRVPFDLAEAEQELVGGYHTEYSSMRFALFFLAEYAGMITTSLVCVALFFGGWHIPWLDKIWPETFGNTANGQAHLVDSLGVCILRSLVIFGKALVVMFVFMWTRWSLPRFRFDQLMVLAWRALIPMSLALLLVNALVVYYRLPHDPEFLAYRRLNGMSALVFFAVNSVVVIVTMLVSTVLPQPAETNRKMRVPGSRFNPAPVAG